MVIGIDESPISKAKLSPNQQLAPPLQRIAAFVIDHCIVIPPVLLLLVSPLEAKLKTAMIVGQDYRAAILFILISLLAVFSVFCYHLISNLFLSATLGQKILKLKVVDAKSLKSLSPVAAVTRSFGFVINLFVFCLGSLSVFSDKDRRAFYEHISQSMIIGQDGEYVQAPTALGSYAVRLFYASVSFVVLSFILGTLYLALSQPFDRELLVDSMQESALLCTEVTESHEAWPNKENASRLEVAITLFFSGQIDSECLQAEVDPQLMLMSEDGLYYFTKFLIHVEDPDLASSYQLASCDEDKGSYQCKLGMLIKSVVSDDWTGVATAAKKINESEEESPVYLKVWLAEKLLKLEQYFLVEDLVHEIPDIQLLTAEKSYLQIKSFIGQGKTAEAMGALAVAKPQLTIYEEGELIGSLCQASVDSACTSELSDSCNDFMDWLDDHNVPLSIQSSLTVIEANSCAGQLEHVAQSELAPQLHASTFLLMDAVIANEVKELENLTENIELPSEVRLFAMRKVLEQSDDPEALVRAELMSERVQPGAKRLGKYLLSRWSQLRDFEKVASFINKRKKQWGNLDPEMLKHLVVSEYYLGKPLLAKKYLLKLPNLSEPQGDRQPASINRPTMEDEFKLILEEFRGDIK